MKRLDVLCAIGSGLLLALLGLAVILSMVELRWTSL